MKFRNFLFVFAFAFLAFYSVCFAENPGGGGGHACPLDGYEPTVAQELLAYPDLAKISQNLSEAYEQGEITARPCLAAEAALLQEASERTQLIQAQVRK